MGLGVSAKVKKMCYKNMLRKSTADFVVDKLGVRDTVLSVQLPGGTEEGR